MRKAGTEVAIVGEAGWIAVLFVRIHTALVRRFAQRCVVCHCDTVDCSTQHQSTVESTQRVQTVYASESAYGAAS